MVMRLHAFILQMYLTILCFSLRIIIDYSMVNVLKFTGVMVAFQSASYNVTESNSYVEVGVVKQGLSDVNVTVLLRNEDRTARGKCKVLDCQKLAVFTSQGRESV